jgi:hypothetical protein
MTTISDIAALEAVLKADLMQEAGTPVLTFLQTTETVAQTLAANAQPSAAEITTAAAQESAAWIVLQAGVMGSLPNLGAEVIVALTQFVMGKVQAALGKVPAAAK